MLTQLLERLPRPAVPDGHQSLWGLIAERIPWAVWRRREWVIFFITVTAILLLGGASMAHAEGNDGLGPSTVTAFGDLFDVPDLSDGGQKTLFETYDLTTWAIDTDLGTWDILQKAGNGLVTLLFWALACVIYALIAVVYWLLSITAIPELQESMAGIVGGTATSMMEWLFPSALAIGGVVAYALKQRDGQGAFLGQWTWVLVMGLFSVSLAITPAVWTNGAGSVRQLGAETITTATAEGLGTLETYPIETDPVEFGTDPQATALRKTGDAIWRGMVATPWCLVQFGSVEACNRYALEFLDAGLDEEARTDLIKKNVYPSEGDGNSKDGENSETGQWVKGNRPWERLGMAALTLLVALVFAIVVLIMAMAATFAVITMYILLAVGAFFVMLWVIPGRPRQWGVAWFESLIGAIMNSLVHLLLFSALITVITALMASMDSLGWGKTIMLVLGVCLAVLGVKKTVERILGIGGVGGGNALLGYLALRGGAKLAKGVGRGVGRMARGLGGGPGRAATTAPRRGGPAPESRPSPGPGRGNRGPGRRSPNPTPASTEPMERESSAEGRSPRRARRGAAESERPQPRTARSTGRGRRARVDMPERTPSTPRQTTAPNAPQQRGALRNPSRAPRRSYAAPRPARRPA